MLPLRRVCCCAALLLAGAVTLGLVSSVGAFQQQQQQQQSAHHRQSHQHSNSHPQPQPSVSTSTTLSYRPYPTSLTMAQLPTLNGYKIDANGRVVGVCTGHPDINDGEVITTSPLADTSRIRDGAIVTTQSGSKYKLGASANTNGTGKTDSIYSSGAGDATTSSSILLPLDLHVDLDLDLFGLKSTSKSSGSSSSATHADGRSDNVVGAATDNDDDDLPIMDEWRVLWNGRVVGSVANHPVFSDGDVITTSAIADPDAAADGQTVTTYSGSQYKLGTKMAPWKALVGQISGGGEEIGGGIAARGDLTAAANGQVAAIQSPQSGSNPKPPKSLRERKRDARAKCNLTGQTAAGGRYLLSGKAFRTTSGKSHIYSAYRSDDEGLPTGDLIAIKVSTNCPALTRENGNYDRIMAAGCGNRFVKKHEFIDKWGGPSFANACALVLESGHQDLKSVMAARGGMGLDGPAMRDAAYAAAQCVQAMHSSGLVWTDLKPENFIVTSRSIGDDGLEGVKGIDLESAIPVGDNPVDYSPEACPPEFAVAFHDGLALDHVLDYTYDIWSLGMLLYELSTGKSYFEHETPEEITQILSQDFRADVRAVNRNRLRNLIGKCLQKDPRKRPRISEVLLHPYFLTTGMGWY